MIIGLGHRRGTGKDTFGKFLVDALCRLPSTKSVKMVGFADGVKDICYQIYKHHGLKPGPYYEDHRDDREVVLESLGMSPRELWIKFGTNAVRQQVYERTWLEMTIQNCSREPGHHTIIKDTRFPNEGDEILGAGGILLKVTNSRVQESDDVADSAMCDYDRWTGRIQNEGTLEDLVADAKVVALRVERMEQ